MKYSTCIIGVLGVFVISLTAADIELRDGSMLKGDVVSKTVTSITVKTLLGEQVVLLEQLAPRMLQELQLGSGDDVGALRATIAELQKRIGVLEAENQHLRRQLVEKSTAVPAASATPPPTRSAPSQPGVQVATPATQGSGYWISSTGKRHKSSCRYYRTTQGHEGTADEGTPCKICGG